MEDLIGIALRISVMYVYVLTLLRISGKRSIDSLSPLDFVVATIIGDMFEDFIWAEIPLSQWLVGITTIIFLHTLMSFAEHKSDWIHNLLESKPTPVIRHGKLIRQGMERERTNKDEVLSQLRLLGEEKMAEVKEADWEPGGEMSLIKTEAAEEVKKQDLDALKKVFP